MSEDQDGVWSGLPNLISFSPKFSFCKKATDRTVPLLHRMICDNQADLIQYIVLGDQHHIALEKTLKSSLVNPDKLRTAFATLDGNLNLWLDLACQHNFKLLIEYFTGRSPRPPRVCIKAPLHSDQNGESVTGIFRNRDVSYDSTYLLEKNTGFRTVRDTGQYFLENDLPRAAQRTNGQRKYQNPRLRPDCVQGYKPLSKWQKRNLRKKFGYIKDENWVKCWRNNPDRDDEDIEIAEDACYKSTLIVPITLLGHSAVLLPEFKKAMALDWPKSKAPEDKYRVIYGFLCMDHIEDEYFDELPDMRVGYIFADILSFYFIMRRYYTVHSDVYNEAKSRLES